MRREGWVTSQRGVTSRLVMGGGVTHRGGTKQRSRQAYITVCSNTVVYILLAFSLVFQRHQSNKEITTKKSRDNLPMLFHIELSERSLSFFDSKNKNPSHFADDKPSGINFCPNLGT